MHHESSVTSLSWIPSKPTGGSQRLRTSTLVALAPCRVASAQAAELDRGALHELARDHRRERAGRS